MSKLTQFGHSFQVKALSVLITDRDFLQQSADIVSPDYFDNDASKWIIKKTLNYYNKYKTIPTMEVFKVEIEKIKNEVQSVAVKELIKGQGVSIVLLASSLNLSSISVIYSCPMSLSTPAFNALSIKFLISS